MAVGLGKQTIAEFVGDAATVDLLRQYGVNFAQGYHIGKPRPLVEMHMPPTPGGPDGANGSRTPVGEADFLWPDNHPGALRTVVA
jgi:predicted signal transduction protein with EAL and GGDEF domain